MTRREIVDREALDTAWPEISGRLRPVAIARAGDEAGDVLQETYLRAVELLPRTTLPASRLPLWLLRILERIALEHARRRPHTAPIAAEDGPRWSALDPDAALESLRQAEALRALVEGVNLTPGQRRYMLVRLEAQSDADAAESLGVSVETLQQERSRALRRIRAVVDAALALAGGRS